MDPSILHPSNDSFTTHPNVPDPKFLQRFRFILPRKIPANLLYYSSQIPYSPNLFPNSTLGKRTIPHNSKVCRGRHVVRYRLNRQFPLSLHSRFFRNFRPGPHSLCFYYRSNRLCDSDILKRNPWERTP